MPSEIIQHIPTLPNVVVTGEHTVHAIHQCVESALAALTEGDESWLHVTVYVDRPDGVGAAELDAVLQTLRSTYELSHLVIRIDDRPTAGNPLPEGSGRDPVVVAAQRAASRVASALMHAEDLDMNERLSAAFQVFNGITQTCSPEQLPWLLQQIATIGWRLGDHPIVEAGRRFGGLPPSVYDRGDFEDVDVEPAAFLPRCVELASALGADPEQERRFQELDARAASLEFPTETVPWVDDAQMQQLFWGLAQRVLREAQDLGEVVSADEVGDLWSIEATGEPMQDLCNLGPSLRFCVLPGSRDDIRDGLGRVSLAFDLFGLAAMGVHVTPGSSQRALQCQLADGVLRYVLAEASVCIGRLAVGSGSLWQPLQLPFWPFDARQTVDPQDAQVLQAATARVKQWLEAGEVVLPEIDVLRRLAASSAGSPHTRDLASDLHSLLDVCVMKLAHARGADLEQWIQASRQFELQRVAEA